jgi:type IV pilus assembly protein PilB
MLPQGKLGELLVERGLITAEHLQIGLEKQTRIGGRIGSILVKLGFIREEELLRFLSMCYDLPQIDLRNVEISDTAVQRIDARLAKHCAALPIKFVGRPPDTSVLIVATPDPTNLEALEQVRQAAGCQIEPFVCSFGMFELYFEEAYQNYSPPADVEPLLAATDPGRLTRALARLLIDKKVLTRAELKSAIDSHEF